MTVCELRDINLDKMGGSKEKCQGCENEYKETWDCLFECEYYKSVVEGYRRKVGNI